MKRRSFIKTIGTTGSLGVASTLLASKTWAVQGSEKGSLRFVFYTDIHADNRPGISSDLAHAAGAINQERADLILAGGDLVSGGFSASKEAMRPTWDSYMQMHRAIDSDIYPAIGNHDLVGADKNKDKTSSDPRDDFKKHLKLDKTYYSFNASGYHFIILDSLEITNDTFKYKGYVNQEQLEWLREDLSNLARETPIILLTHMPLLTGFFQATVGSEAAAPANRVVVNNKEVLSLFADRNLLLVLQGHLHVNEMLVWNKTRFITGGAICGAWWNGDWHGTSAGFGVITLKENSISWNYHVY